jgi:stage V sporulation protein S
VEIIKVSAKSSPNSVAAAMVAMLRQNRSFDVSVVGAGALNQAVKAIAIARTLASHDGLDIVTIPSFALVDIAGEERTALALRVEHRPGPLIDLRDTETSDRETSDSETLDSGLPRRSDVPLSP